MGQNRFSFLHFSTSMKPYRIKRDFLLRELRFKFLERHELNSLLKRVGMESEYPSVFFPVGPAGKIIVPNTASSLSNSLESVSLNPQPTVTTSYAILHEMTKWFIERGKQSEFLDYLIIKNLELDLHTFNLLLESCMIKSQDMHKVVARMELLGIKFNERSFELLVNGCFNTVDTVKLMHKQQFVPSIELGQLIIQSLCAKSEYEDAFQFIKSINEAHKYELVESMLESTLSTGGSRFVLYDLYNHVQDILDSHLIKLFLKHALKVKDFDFGMELKLKHHGLKNLEHDFKYLLEDIQKRTFIEV